MSSFTLLFQGHPPPVEVFIIARRRFSPVRIVPPRSWLRGNKRTDPSISYRETLKFIYSFTANNSNATKLVILLIKFAEL